MGCLLHPGAEKLPADPRQGGRWAEACGDSPLWNLPAETAGGTEGGQGTSLRGYILHEKDYFPLEGWRRCFFVLFKSPGVHFLRGRDVNASWGERIQHPEEGMIKGDERTETNETANKKINRQNSLLDSRFQTVSGSASSACKHQRFTHCAIFVHPLHCRRPSLCSSSSPPVLSHNLCSASFVSHSFSSFKLVKDSRPYVDLF